MYFLSFRALHALKWINNDSGSQTEVLCFRAPDQGVNDCGVCVVLNALALMQGRFEMNHDLIVRSTSVHLYFFFLGQY